jgi:hypothetical protein
MHVRRELPLLDLDPDLGMLVPDDRRELCRRELDVELCRLARGPWSAGGEQPDPEHPGLLLVDGVIAREVVVSDTVSTELLGRATSSGHGPSTRRRRCCRARSAGTRSRRAAWPCSTAAWTGGRCRCSGTSTVSTAIGELAARGELIRRADGSWLLKGEPVGAPIGGAERVVPVRRRLLGPRGAAEPVGLEAT